MNRSRLILITMCAGYFLVLLDVTIVNVALPAIGRGLGAGTSGLTAVVDGYAVALAALLLVAGTVGDLVGHRRVVLAGLAAFGLGSAGCALAPATGWLVAARVVQGIGAATMLPSTLAVVSRAFPDPGERSRAVAVWAAVGSIALPAGPVLGGALVSTIGWRWVFAINLPVVAAASVVTALRASDDRGEEPPRPVFPWHLLRRPSFATANAVAAAMNLGTLGLLFVLTRFLQDVQGRSALQAGLAVLPLGLPLCLLAAPLGRLAGRSGPRVLVVAGLVLMAGGAGLLTAWSATSHYQVLFPALLVWGLGLALLTPSVVAAALLAAPDERAGFASGLNNTARQVGGAVGVAAYGALVGGPTRTGAFMHGLHVVALVTVVLWLTSAAAGLRWIRPASASSRSGSTRRRRPSPRPS